MGTLGALGDLGPPRRIQRWLGLIGNRGFYNGGQRENRTWSYPMLRFLIVVELSGKQAIDNSVAGDRRTANKRKSNL